MVTVVLYSKKNDEICEVQDLKSNSGKTLIKEVTDFMYIRKENQISKHLHLCLQRCLE